jgi:hypothetical protein
MIDDLDIRRAARLLIQQRGAGATAYAEQWIRALEEVGNDDGVRRLQHVVKEIERLANAPAAEPCVPAMMPHQASAAVKLT